MKNFIKSRTGSIGNSGSKCKSNNSNPSSADPKNPVIVHLSMQQAANNSSAFGKSGNFNADQQIYLNPSELCQPHVDLSDPSRHQFEPPNISLASGVHPVTSRGTSANPPQSAFLPSQNYPMMSAEVTPQATPIASKKLHNGGTNSNPENSGGSSSAGFSNYMPMSECGSQNSKDSGRGTHEQTTSTSANQHNPLSPPSNAPLPNCHGIYPHENLYIDEASNERRMRHQAKLKQHKNIKKYMKDRSAHHRRSRRLGRSLSASSLSTVDKHPSRRSKERGVGGGGGVGGHTYKVYDGDFLTKPGNRMTSEDSGVQLKVSSAQRGRQAGAIPRASKYESEHFESVGDSTHERDRSYSGGCHCQCEQTLELVARKVEHLKLAILEKMEYSQGSYDRKMEELDKRVRHQLNSLDKIFKERVNSEKSEAIQRMDKKILQERMAIAEEIRKTEMRVDRTLKDWCESRYQRVDSRLQGSSDRAHSDSGLSRRHSIGDGSSSVGTGDSSKCYRDSGAFECSSTTSTSDVGVKTPSDSYPVRAPWSSGAAPGSNRHQSNTRKESPLVSEKSSVSSARCSLQSTSSGGTSASKARSRGTSPVASSANLSIHSHSSGGKADSISDILDCHVDMYATSVQQYGTVRRKSRPRLETASTALDDNESCFGDNESVSQIPILTLPSENFVKMTPGSQNGQQQLKSTSTSSHHQRSASGLSATGSNHYMIPNQTSQQSKNQSHHLPDMAEDLRQFKSQYLNHRANTSAKGNNAGPSSTQRPSVASMYEESKYPPCDFEKMKRLDSSNSSSVPSGSSSSASSIPPVLPPRGLDMSRSGHAHYSNSSQSQGNGASQDDKEALQRRIKELEDTLHHYTSIGPATNKAA